MTVEAKSICFRETDLLNKTFRFLEDVGACIATVLCNSLETGTFFSIICESQEEKDNYFIFKLDYDSNVITILEPREIRLVMSALEAHSARFDLKLNIDYSIIKSLIDVFEKETFGYAHINIFRFKNVKVYSGLSERINPKHIWKLVIENQSIQINDSSIVQSMQAPSCVFDISVSDVHDCNLKKISLYNDVQIQCLCGSIIIEEKGIITKVDSHGDIIRCFMQTYQMELLQTTIGNTLFKDIRNPFTMIRYIFESADADINGINIDGEILIEANYLVIMSIKNLEFVCEPFTIGDVRFSEEISLTKDYTDILAKDNCDKNVLVWTYISAKNHFEALEKAKEKIEKAVDILNIHLKNDMLFSGFGLTRKIQSWDIRNHFPRVELSDKIYIENCFNGEKIITENQFYEPHIRTVSQKEIDDLPAWVEVGYDIALHDNTDMDIIMNAIRWINKCWLAGNKYDKIIYAIMALEFCLNGESGNGVIDDLLEKSSIENDKISIISKRLIKKLIKEITIKDELDEILLKEIQNKVKSETQRALSQPSFNSRLKQIAHRLSIPLSDDDLILIAKARKIRNTMIHGSGMNELTTVEIKKLCGITARIITYKYLELTERNVE